MHKHYKFLITAWVLLCSFCNQIIGQQTLTRKETDLPFTILKSNNDTLSIQTVIKSGHLFKPSKYFVENAHPSDTYWLKIDFKEELRTLETADLWYLMFTKFDYAIIYYSENNVIKREGCGELNSKILPNSLIYAPGVPFSLSKLINERYLYLKIKSIVEIPSLIVQPFVENAIIHGLLNKRSGSKNLTINFKKTKKILFVK